MKKYNTPEVEIEMFNVTDVIVASGCGDDCPALCDWNCPVYPGDL